MIDVLGQKRRYAQKMARRQYAIDPGMQKIFWVLGPTKAEQDASEPVKLLQVNKDTMATGILPLFFPIIPEEGFPFRSVIIEITPEEYKKVKSRELNLPNGWKLGPLIPPAGRNGRKTSK